MSEGVRRTATSHTELYANRFT